jgi:SynChlorMet cassette protein ScmC
MCTTLPVADKEISLALMDGSHWRIGGQDEAGFEVVRHLAQLMGLRAGDGSGQRLIVRVAGRPVGPVTDGANGLASGRSPSGADGQALGYLPSRPERDRVASGESPFVCLVRPSAGGESLTSQAMQLALALCDQAEQRGGLLLHGGLAEYQGRGAVLAGPGGRGKSTASRRLPLNWTSLSDDATLVVRDAQGVYWGHPWPTWSRFMPGGPGGAWEVQHAIPLGGVFFLDPAAEERVEPVGVGQAVCLLAATAEQLWPGVSLGRGKVERRARRMQRFQNACTFAQSVRCYLLHLSLTGAFWHGIEQAIAGDRPVSVSVCTERRTA